jgi:Tfp pilus assembly pilus retraction ATPase PilT
LPGRNEGAAFYEDRFIPCRTDAISRSLFGLKQDEKAVAAVQITGFANAVAAQTAAGSTEGGGRVNAVEILAMEDESDETAQKNKNYSNMLEE